MTFCAVSSTYCNFLQDTPEMVFRATMLTNAKLTMADVLFLRESTVLTQEGREPVVAVLKV